MTDPDTAPSEASGTAPAANRVRLRVGLQALFLLGVVAAAVVTVVGERHAFTQSIDRVGVGAFAASAGFGILGLIGNLGTWRSVLAGLGVTPSLRSTTRVFFVTQLGKYLPGSVWPVVMQAQAGRAWGAGRVTMLTANMLSLVLSCTIGLIVACILLPFHGAAALGRYWWALLALPVLVAALHPRAVPAVLDRALRVLHRQPLHARVDVKSEAQAAGWCLFSWVALGAHVAVLCVAVGRGGASVVLLSIGAMALAVPVGVLVIPVPAGAGVREVILGFVLAASLTSGQALAVVVASRVILAGCDLLTAAVAVALGRGLGERSSARTLPG